MRKLTCALTLIALIGIAPVPGNHAQVPDKQEVQKPDPKKVKELMRRKLDHSQKLLEALTLADLAKVGNHADELVKISKEVEWKTNKSRQYRTWSDDFRQNAEALSKAAKENNLQSARLNYLGMTLDCFNCHSYLREQ